MGKVGDSCHPLTRKVSIYICIHSSSRMLQYPNFEQSLCDMKPRVMCLKLEVRDDNNGKPPVLPSLLPFERIVSTNILILVIICMSLFS